MRFDNIIIMMCEKFETWAFWFWKASIIRIIVRKTLWSYWFQSPTPSLDYPAQYPTYGLCEDVQLSVLLPCSLHDLFSSADSFIVYSGTGFIFPQHHYHTSDEKFCFPHCLVTVQQTGYFVLCGMCYSQVGHFLKHPDEKGCKMIWFHIKIIAQN